MESKAYTWLNGRFVEEKDAKIPLLTHALHYGSGVFEGIRAYKTSKGPAVFRLHDHVGRLFFSMKAFDMKIAFSEKDIEKAILKTVAKNKLQECYIRPIAFYGNGMTLQPNPANVQIAIAAWPWGAYLSEHKVLSLGISKYIRFHPQSIPQRAKVSGYYATGVLASLEAKRQGMSEMLLLDHEGYIGEGPGENILLVKDSVLIVPESPAILNGFTRESIMTIAKDKGLKIMKKRVKLPELMRADEAFLAGTATEVAPIGKVKGKRIGTGTIGPITALIKETYMDAVHGEIPKYRKWLSVVK